MNSAMNTTSPARSLALTPSKKRDRDALKKPTSHSLRATASPTTSRVSSSPLKDTTPKKRAREVEQQLQVQLQLQEEAKEGATRQKRQAADQPPLKKLCLVPSTTTATAENDQPQPRPRVIDDITADEGDVPSSVSVEQVRKPKLIRVRSGGMRWGGRSEGERGSTAHLACCVLLGGLMDPLLA